MKTNQFSVNLALPRAFDGDPELSAYMAITRDLEFWCDAADLPGTTQQTIPVRRYGYGTTESVPIVPSFEDVPLRFIADGQGLYWNMFHRWLNKTVNKDSSRGLFDGNVPTEISGGADLTLSPYETAYQTTYIATVLVTVFDPAGNPIRRVVLNQAYPSAVSAIKLDWGDGGDIARFMVNMAIQDWNEARVSD